jgi:hypothetical protein
MGAIFSMFVLLVTISAAFMIGVAVSRKLVAGILHVMMQGRLKRIPTPAQVTFQTAESR